MPSNIPAPRVPMIDARSGLVNRQWYTFFLNLFDRTSTGTNTWSIEDLMQMPPIVPAESGVPTGMIAFFLVSTPPSGWEEVVALRGRFPRGMMSGGTPGATGGSSTHTHTIATSFQGGYDVRDGTGASVTLQGLSHSHGGVTGSADSTPPYVDGMWCRKL